jgi:hypothetical protein
MGRRSRSHHGAEQAARQRLEAREAGHFALRLTKNA